MLELNDVMTARYVDARTLELMTADAYDVANRLPNARIVTSIRVRSGIDATTVRHTASEWQSPGSAGWAIAELASNVFDFRHPLTTIDQLQSLRYTDTPDYVDLVNIAAVIAWVCDQVQRGYVDPEDPDDN